MTLDEIKDRRLRERIQKQIAQEDASYHSHQPVGGLANTERQPHPLPALDQKPQALPSRQSRLPRFLVTITSYRSRKLDSDNLIAGAKTLRDCIAYTCGVDDGDDRITFEYSQVVTRGRPGTHVGITAQA